MKHFFYLFSKILVTLVIDNGGLMVSELRGPKVNILEATERRPFELRMI